jgi:hypothetical protein
MGMLEDWIQEHGEEPFDLESSKLVFTGPAALYIIKLFLNIGISEKTQFLHGSKVVLDGRSLNYVFKVMASVPPTKSL